LQGYVFHWDQNFCVKAEANIAKYLSFNISTPTLGELMLLIFR